MAETRPFSTYWLPGITEARITEALGEGSWACWGIGKDHAELWREGQS